jgi:hypothetical protein
VVLLAGRAYQFGKNQLCLHSTATPTSNLDFLRVLNSLSNQDPNQLVVAYREGIISMYHLPLLDDEEIGI